MAKSTRKDGGGLAHGDEPAPFATAEEIASAVSRVADGVAADVRGPVLAVPILNGALYFAADLLRALALRSGLGSGFTLDGYATALLSSYGDAMEPLHAPRVMAFPTPAALSGRTVLLVDTVVDRGRTVAAARERALAGGAAAARIACLVDKPARREGGGAPDWAGLVAPDVFLVGYGLDVGGRFRTLPWLGALPPKAR